MLFEIKLAGLAVLSVLYSKAYKDEDIFNASYIIIYSLNSFILSPLDYSQIIRWTLTPSTTGTKLSGRRAHR